MAEWPSEWISFSGDPREDVDVFVFRRVLDLDQLPDRCEVRVSADQRYKLYVNETLVTFGPQRGDLNHWFYETVDLAPYFKPGRNVVWALVWNFGYLAPLAQMTSRTGFLLDSPLLGTPTEWDVTSLPGWGFATMGAGSDESFSCVGPSEKIDGNVLANTLMVGLRDDLPWRPAQRVHRAMERGATFEPIWMLVPRSIPPCRYEPLACQPKVRRGHLHDGATSLPAEGSILERKTQLPTTIPLLLDYEELICAYPRLRISGPAGSEVRITYAECLWKPVTVDDPKYGTSYEKGNRSDVEGKEIRGYQDRLILGSEPLVFEPLWWRTYRFLQIETNDLDVTVESIDAIETGYPYEVQSSFEADDPWVKPLWDVSVRTAKRCAGETYFDCPYYEQLQYAGDTRIQALIHYYLSTDRALARNAVEQFGWSMMENGLTQSRYPNWRTQVIPPFSLWWVTMLYDQMLYDGESDRSLGDYEARETNARTIKNAFTRLQKNGGGFWNFADWVPGWRHGEPAAGAMSTVHQLTWLLADYAYNCIEFGGTSAKFSEEWRQKRREGLAKTFTLDRGLIRYTKDPQWQPCEHSEALYRVLQMMNGDQPTPWPTEALVAANADKTTYYFSYYKHQAMQPEDYLAQLGPWKEMIENGLTTYAENPEPVRSDCHAWSAHPALGFFQLIAGVTSIAPQWEKARVAPHPGELKRFDAHIAHPKGALRVQYEDKKLVVESPVAFDLVWKGQMASFASGTHQF